MLALDDSGWTSLNDAYGSAADVPQLLELASHLPEDVGHKSQPYFDLWSRLCHQGDVYSASYAALPHLVRIIESKIDVFRWSLLALVEAIESARLSGRGPVIPLEMVADYEGALSKIPALAGRLFETRRTELEVRVILGACAVAQGVEKLADAIIALTPEVVERLLAGEDE